MPGSSAGGEFPKFAAVRRIDGRTLHALVKFSGADRLAGSRRWADLLVCEHLALELVSASLPSAPEPSRVFHGGGRTFLEVERFDRHDTFGRSPLCLWAAADR